jgi:hypothetical protein
VTLKNWWLPDVIFKVVPIHLLGVLDIKNLTREYIWLHECVKLIYFMLQYVYVVVIGSLSCDSVVSFWSAQASVDVFDIVCSSDDIGARIKKWLEHLS